MDLQRLARSRGGDMTALPEYILTTFVPGIQPLLQKYPSLLKVVGLLVAIWYLSPIARLKVVWEQMASFISASVSVSSEEDLFEYLVSWIADKRTLRADQSLVATSNAPQERRKHRRDPDYEESNRRQHTDTKIRYEQSQGMQIFLHKRRIYFVTRVNGEGHTYHEGRYRRVELINISCLGRSTQPIKDLLEEIYWMHKDREKTLTIIRRPYTGGYSSKLAWSRITAKPRRALDTVILEADQKQTIVDDIEEYMDAGTQAFYGSHGIPYRRGYLFHGPPGVGKTSLALALASRFSLDVYVLTLLDREIGDSDLISLLNQLPSRSLLLLEDIDTAGLSRKGRRAARLRKAMEKPDDALDELDDDSEDEETMDENRSRVSLSGLLNAIDGVAAPEGHILIMTTNKPDDLDDALVRAGRISVRVGFKNATQRQAEEIFLRMYVDSDKQDGMKADAKRFADKIPDHEFSPADLQDYLLVHKKDSKKAVEELDAWKKEILDERLRREEEKREDRKLRMEAKKEKLREKLQVLAMGAAGLQGEVKASSEKVAEEKTVNGKTEGEKTAEPPEEKPVNGKIDTENSTDEKTPNGKLDEETTKEEQFPSSTENVSKRDEKTEKEVEKPTTAREPSEANGVVVEEVEQRSAA